MSITPVSVALTNAMFFTAFAAFTIVTKAIYAGWAVRDTIPFSRIIITQRKRYGFVALAQALMVACAIWLLSLGSISDIVAGMHEWSKGGLFGWVVIIGTMFIPVSPLISALAMLSIYRHPAQMAHRHAPRHQAFCSTKAHRAGSCDTVFPEIVKIAGRPVRIFY